MLKLIGNNQYEYVIKPTMFPDGTSQVWKLPEECFKSHAVYIEWHFEHEGELAQLAQIKLLMDQHSIKVDLGMMYLPYGRQDKPVSNTTTFALHAFAKIINALDFNIIQIFDPHSEVVFDLIPDAEDFYAYDEITKLLAQTQPDLICYPDAGAYKKYIRQYKHLVSPERVIYGEKKRDPLTGYILEYNLKGEETVKDRSVLIMDDICDGGKTFEILAGDLIKAGAKEVNLFVSHGLFTKGLTPLKKSGINKIYTKDGEISEVQGNIAYRTL